MSSEPTQRINYHNESLRDKERWGGRSMSKSHTEAITVKAKHYYGGSNFLYDCLNGGYAFKTYEYLWGSQLVTFECCACNWAADKSYNALAIYSDRGEEVYEEYDADSETTHTVSCTIGSVVGDSFTIMPHAGTYLSATNFMWTCYIIHTIYKKEQDLTHGYYIIPIYFKVPYTWKLNTEFTASVKVRAAYGGTGTPTQQDYYFDLVELYDASYTTLDYKYESLFPGDETTVSLSTTFDEDMKKYSLGVWYIDPETNESRRMIELCWCIKAVEPYGVYTNIDIKCERP